MIEQTTAAHHKSRKTKSVTEAVGFGLAGSAVIAACCICFFLKMPIAIENPEIPAFASFFILVHFKSKPSIEAIQKIIGFYLIAVLVNQLSSQYFQISFLPVGLSVSFGSVVLLLCAIGFVMGKTRPANTPKGSENKDLLYSWLPAFGIIIIHMGLLVLMLNRFYGYGYDRNFSVLGNLCLYFLLFIFLRGKLDKLRFRQVIGLILTIFFSVVTIAKRCP